MGLWTHASWTQRTTVSAERHRMHLHCIEYDLGAHFASVCYLTLLPVSLYRMSMRAESEGHATGDHVIATKRTSNSTLSEWVSE